MSQNKVRSILAAISFMFAVPYVPAFAQQAWPTRPVTIIIPDVAGSATDLEMREYGEKLSAVFGKPFINEMKPGAGGTIASAYVARARSDTHTLLAISTSYVVAPATNDFNFDPIQDIIPVSLMSSAPVSLLANPKFPANNIKEFIAYAKANPGKVLWGDGGQGTIAHIAGVWLEAETGIELTFVHYKGGAPATVDLVAGRINVQSRSLSGPLAMVRAGQIKVIGGLSAKRDPLVPDVLTAQESGIKDFDQPSFSGVSITGGADRAVVTKLSIELAKIAKDPEVVKKNAAEGNIMVGSTPEEFSSYMSNKIAFFKKLVKDKNIKAE